MTGVAAGLGVIAHRRARRLGTGQFVAIGELDMISTVQELAAEALFVSDLQPSQCPTRVTVEETVTAMILRHGSDGCAAEVAAEFGDHPDIAVRRMSWVRSELHSQMAAPRRPHFAS